MAFRTLTPGESKNRLTVIHKLCTVIAMNLWRAEITFLPTTSHFLGGAIVELPSGVRKSLSWQAQTPIRPTLDAAKEYTAALLDSIPPDDANRINIPSTVAALQRIIIEYNERVVAHIRDLN